MYFNGIAIPKSTRKEIASKVLINLNNLTEISTVLFFLAKIHVANRYTKFYVLFMEIIIQKTDFQKKNQPHGNGTFNVW